MSRVGCRAGACGGVVCFEQDGWGNGPGGQHAHVREVRVPACLERSAPLSVFGGGSCHLTVLLAAQMKRELLRLAPLLPYGASITDNTLASHARTIVRLSGVVAAAGGDGGASASSGAAPAIPGGEGGPGLASASAVFLERQQEAAAAAAAAEAALEADEGGEGLALVGRGPKRRRRGRPGQQQQQQTSEGADEEQTQGDGLSDLSDSELDQYVLPSPRRKQPLLRAQ